MKIIRIDMEPLHHHIEMAYKCETRNLVSAYRIISHMRLETTQIEDANFTDFSDFATTLS